MLIIITITIAGARHIYAKTVPSTPISFVKALTPTKPIEKTPNNEATNNYIFIFFGIPYLSKILFFEYALAAIFEADKTILLNSSSCRKF